LPRLHLLRVFCGDGESGGNPLAVFLDGAEVPPVERQDVAADLGLSETVFVDDAGLRIFTPTVEIDFAGHPTVGTAWLMATERQPVESLQVRAGLVGVRYDGGDAFVSALPEWGPAFEWERLGSPEYVDALIEPPRGHDHIGVWAWIDEDAGLLRARVFPVRYGVPEDEATGSAATELCAELRRPIEIRQGRGSLIHARPLADRYVEIGGTCVLDDVRDYKLA
jgi:predicted PhzF superfamily epimerase YddE/YHI9